MISFQDRHIPIHSQNGEPVLDHSQDYVLLSGYENKTHTVIRFRRKLDTCDEKYDVSITVSLPSAQLMLKPRKLFSLLFVSLCGWLLSSYNFLERKFSSQTMKSAINQTLCPSILYPIFNTSCKFLDHKSQETF